MSPSSKAVTQLKHTRKIFGGKKIPTDPPLWKGPEEDGLTYSILCRFLTCRERFRLLVVNGLSPEDRFNHRIQYGHMWHACEEYTDWSSKTFGGAQLVGLTDLVSELDRQYPMERQDIHHWSKVCRVQYPIYFNYWRVRPARNPKEPLLREEVFSEVITLPSGRRVRLRGKMDGADLVREGKAKKVILQENKTKGEIAEQQLLRQLNFDFQTMIYLTALTLMKQPGSNYSKDSPETWEVLRRHQIGGVLYNVVRRPLAGGKHSIRMKQGERQDEFYQRLKEAIAGDPEYFFMRWSVTVTTQEIHKFCNECLYPMLEQMCDWWEWIQRSPHDPFSIKGAQTNTIHWRHPFGVYNILDEGGSTELDEYLATGGDAGLRKLDRLFKELT